MKVEVQPELLIARFGEFTHSDPILDTFRHFADSETYKTDIGELGDNQIDFGLSARPRGKLSNTMELLLSANPFGPSVELSVFEREGNGQRFPRLTYRTGWEYDFYHPDYPNSYVLVFIRELRTEGTSDPVSDEGKWLLEVIQYMDKVNSAYFLDRGINPEPKVFTLDQFDHESDTASRRFLATLT